jgi:hypothetical protein
MRGTHMKRSNNSAFFEKTLLGSAKRSAVDEAIATKISHEDILVLVRASFRRDAQYQAILYRDSAHADKPDLHEPASPIDDVRAAVYSLESSISQMTWLAEKAGTPFTVEHVRSMTQTELAKRIAEVMFGKKVDILRIYTELEDNAHNVRR